MSTSSSSTSGEHRRLEVGHISRAHGLRGDVAVTLITDRTERLDPGSVLHTERGDLDVVSARPDGARWLVHFAQIDDRDEAERWRGTALLADALDDPDELWVHELVGCRVRSSDGVDRGVVTALQANPASDLLVLDSGALVPLRFVVDGPTDGLVVVDVPDGLWDL
jgi:16S rRNA processing protein RimM